MLQATKNEEKAIHECYRRLYKSSTPSADFDELVKNASINESGEKQIDFNSYEIDYEKYHQIIKDVIKEYKIQKWKRQLFHNTISLGCSPKFKEDEFR
jgi:hypothetical protein